MTNDELIRQHYEKVAESQGASPCSTMEDATIREREAALILETLGRAGAGGALDVLDLGCGNGYMLSRVIEAYPGNRYRGLDFSEQLLGIARSRGMACDLGLGDARDLPYQDRSFDLVYTERCLINILDASQQARALEEIHRVLRPGGYYLMIEAFTDGLELSNKARKQLGLEPIGPPYHNRFMDKAEVLAKAGSLFQGPPDGAAGVVPPPAGNFLSTHYFLSRVFYPAVTRAEVVRNSEFVLFFSQFLGDRPPVGNYSPIQAFLFRK
jgi:ubiquinone/menaquinone biosynthesis C-methylase UbiE